MIRIEDLHVHYRAHGSSVHAVQGVSIEVQQGEFYTLLGPSGCGKTTTLRCLAGLETPTAGRITIGSEVVFDSATATLVPAHRRDIGMVFQSYAIWPHMSVAENVAFPLQESRRGVSRDDIRRRVGEALERVQLSAYADRPAPFLSGGQQQRLALARAIVREPAVLLLDEPLSNLDAKLREETRIEIRNLVKRLNVTTIYVTHDQVEALSMADRVAIMESGRIAQEASPRAIYQQPNSRFVASFVGKINFVPGRIRSDRAIETSWGILRGTVPAAAGEGAAVTVAIRPENLFQDNAPQGGGDGNLISGTVSEVIFLGDTLECRVACGNDNLGLRLHPSSSVAVGATIDLRVAERDLLVLTA